MERTGSRLLQGPGARPGFSALRRAGRAALVMPAMFALGTEVIGNPAIATSAPSARSRCWCWSSSAGRCGVACRLRPHLRRSAWCSSAWGRLLPGQRGWPLWPWPSSGSPCFRGSRQLALAGATVSLLLAFILPVSLPGPASSIPGPIGGKAGPRSAASFLSPFALLWPAPVRNPLRAAAVAACRALAARLRTEVAYMLEGESTWPSRAELDAAILCNAGRSRKLAGCIRTFFATPYRPTGLEHHGPRHPCATHRRAEVAERRHRARRCRSFTGAMAAQPAGVRVLRQDTRCRVGARTRRRPARSSRRTVLPTHSTPHSRSSTNRWRRWSETPRSSSRRARTSSNWLS